MKLSLESRRNLLFAVCFLAVMLFGFCVAFLPPSMEQKCAKTCNAEGKHGQLVPIYPAWQTGSKEGPKTCECR